MTPPNLTSAEKAVILGETDQFAADAFAINCAFNGVMGDLLLFTDCARRSPSYGGTFAVPARDYSPARLARALIDQQARFAKKEAC